MACENCEYFENLNNAILSISYGVCKKSGRAVFKSSVNCRVEEWHRRYIMRLIAVADITHEQAKDCMEAGIGEHDYGDEPEDSADDEMSYWAADS